MKTTLPIAALIAACAMPAAYAHNDDHHQPKEAHAAAPGELTVK